MEFNYPPSLLYPRAYAVSTIGNGSWWVPGGYHLLQELIMGESVYDIDTADWVWVCGSDIQRKAQYSDIMRYNGNGDQFEFLLGILNIGRSCFSALLYQVSDKC